MIFYLIILNENSYNTQQKIDKCEAELEDLPHSKSYEDMLERIEQMKVLFIEDEQALTFIGEVEMCMNRNLKEAELLELHRDMIVTLTAFANNRKRLYKDLAENASDYRKKYYQSYADVNYLANENERLSTIEAESDSTKHLNNKLLDKVKDQTKEMKEIKEQMILMQRELEDQKLKTERQEENSKAQEKQLRKVNKHLILKNQGMEARYDQKLQDQKELFSMELENLENRFEIKLQRLENEIQDLKHSNSSTKFKSTMREAIEWIRNDVLKEISVFLNVKIEKLDQIQEAAQVKGETLDTVNSVINDFLIEAYGIGREDFLELLNVRKELNAFIHSGLFIDKVGLDSLRNSDDDELNSLIMLYDPIKNVAENKLALKENRKARKLCFRCGIGKFHPNHVCLKCTICSDKGHDSNSCPRAKRCQRRREAMGC